MAEGQRSFPATKRGKLEGRTGETSLNRLRAVAGRLIIRARWHRRLCTLLVILISTPRLRRGLFFKAATLLICKSARVTVSPGRAKFDEAASNVQKRLILCISWENVPLLEKTTNRSLATTALSLTPARKEFNFFPKVLSSPAPTLRTDFYLSLAHLVTAG